MRDMKARVQGEGLAMASDNEKEWGIRLVLGMTINCSWWKDSDWGLLELLL